MSQFFSGTLAPFWPHFWLIAGCIIGGALVGLGVILEAKEILSLPVLAVFVGVVLEAACTLLLFGFDERISNKQQSTIEQMLSRRHLSPKQRDRLIAVTKKFPSLNFVTITVTEDEPWGFVMEIADVLQHNGWKWLPCDGSLPKLTPQDAKLPASCWTIVNGIQIDGSQNLSGVVDALAKALKEPEVIGMDNIRPEISEAFPTIAIMVGTKR